MPKRTIRLVFYSNDIVPVEIFGIVESVEANPFSKDPEFQVSVICPDPYFIALEPTVITGQSIRAGGTVREVEYNGSVEIGMHVKVEFASGATPALIGIQIGDPAISYFNVNASVSTTKYFEMSSLPMQKFVQNVDLTTGVISNLLSKVVQEGSSWPLLQPGTNEFSVVTDAGVQDWELTFYERFGGL
jgi:hypothetical protein